MDMTSIIEKFSYVKRIFLTLAMIQLYWRIIEDMELISEFNN